MDDDYKIIIEETTLTFPEYETACSRKRKDEPQPVVEEVVFNYLTGLYEKVKKSRLESEDELHEETETVTGDATLQNHILAETDSTTFNCKSCQFRAVSKQQLKFHLFKAHLQGMYSVYFKCKICNFKTTHAKPMVIHQTDHRNKKETRAIVSDISLNNNVEINIVPKNVTLKVEKCQEFERLSSIKNYNKDVYKCFDCKYVAKKRESLQNHVIQHEYSDFNCDEHLSLKNGCLKCVYKCCLLMLPYKTLKCSKCGFKTNSYNRYVKHNNRIMDCTNRNKLRTQHSAKKNQNGANKELKCYHCSYFTDSRYSLKLHAEKHYKQRFNCDRHPRKTDNECTKCLFKTILEELAGEVEFSEHQNSLTTGEEAQTINLCSDNSEDEDCDPENCMVNSNVT